MTIAERPVDEQKATTRFHVLILYQTTLGIESKESLSYYNTVKYGREESHGENAVKFVRLFKSALSCEANRFAKKEPHLRRRRTIYGALENLIVNIRASHCMGCDWLLVK